MCVNEFAKKAFCEVFGGDEHLTAENLAAEMKSTFSELMNARVVHIGNKLVLDFDKDMLFGVVFEKI